MPIKLFVFALLLCWSPVSWAKDTTSSVPLLMRLMQQTMVGRGVLAVSSGERDGKDPHPERAFREGDKILTRLQAVGEAASSDSLTLIPFRVGDAWVLAPESQEVSNRNPKTLEALSRESQAALVDRALLALSEESLRRLGDDGGISVRYLPENVQSWLAKAFAPPIAIVDRTGAEAEKQSEGPVVAQTVATLAEPLDWSRAQIRARLVTSYVNDDLPGEEFSMLRGRPRPPRREFYLSSKDATRATRPSDPPFFVSAPNTFEPSDLDTDPYTQPIGLSGAQPLPKVLERLSAVTGLKLAGRTHRSATVFIGSSAMRCGDVLEGIRLALTGSWRKLGDTYILAWDREGLAAVQQRLKEAAGGFDRSANIAEMQRGRSAEWLPLLRILSFAEDDPLALTDAQRQRLFRAYDAGSGEARIPYSEMTAEQKTFVSAQTSAAQVKTPGGSRPYNPADLERLFLSGEAHLELSLGVPGFGWVYVPDDWLVGPRGGTRAIARRASAPSATSPESSRSQAPRAIQSPIRGLVVPALGPGRLAELADEMARHGLNTLFYPALRGGYATFPTESFPLEPALRGANGWAAAVSAMRPNGIAVVGYLETLAWQLEGDRAHWLNRHPDWYDVDVLGRPRLAWLESHPGAGHGPWTLANANYVSPLAPGVEDRLNRLLSDFANRADATAVGFTAYRPPESDWDGLAPPPLGYTTEERLSALRATGGDPVDLSRKMLDPMPENLRRVWRKDLQAFLADERSPDPRAALVARLLERARVLKPGWRTYLLDDVEVLRAPRVGPKEEKPKADVVLSASLHSRPRDAGVLATFGVVPPSASETRSSIAVVYDFRAAPDRIRESLSWILPPASPS